MKGRVKPYQYVIMLFCFVHGSKLLLSFMDNAAKQDSWLITISGFLLSIPFILSFALLSKRFPDKNLVEIFEAVFGRIPGAAVSVLYILFMFYVFTLNLRTFSDFYTGNILTETPSMAILVALAVCVSAIAVRLGIDSIAKISIIIAAIVIIAEVTTIILLIGDIDFSNFMPVLSHPASVYAQTTLLMAAIPYCNVFMFMMVLPEVGDKRRLGRMTFTGIASCALLFLLITVRNTAVLGPTSTVYAITSYEVVRMINLGEFLTRVELLVALGLTLSMFFKVCVIFFGVLKGISSLLRLKSYNSLLWPLGAAAIVYAMVVQRSSVSNMETASKYYIILALPFEFIIPPLTLLIAKLRKLPGGKASAAPAEEKPGAAPAEGQPENG